MHVIAKTPLVSFVCLQSLTVHFTNSSTRLIGLRHHTPLITGYKQAHKVQMWQVEVPRLSCIGARPTHNDTFDTYSKLEAISEFTLISDGQQPSIHVYLLKTTMM